MIFFQIILFLISIILFSISIAGYGNLLSLKKENNFFLDVFLGFIVISFVVTFIHFFFKIDLKISSLIFIFGLIAFFKKKENYFKIFKTQKKYYLIIIILFIPMFLSQKYHEDFGYYHLPYALGFLEEKIIFGYANIDQSYVYNSIWLNLYSLFFLNDKNFNFLTLPTYILFLSFILFSLSQVISKKKNIFISDYYLIVILFYFILKFTRISEFGVDFPAIIFSTLAIYYFMKYFEINLIKKKKNYYFLILIFSIFSILIKLSTLPIIFLSIYIFLKDLKKYKFSIFNFQYLFIFLFFLLFLIQQFIYTGCIFFPTNFTCLEVSWFNSEYSGLSKKLELVNKSYYYEGKNFYTPEEYLNNFNWVYFWIKRNLIEISEHFLTILIPSLLFIFFLKNKNQTNILFNGKFILYIFLTLSIIFWLHFSPVYRFAIHLFATLIFILISKFLITKKFSKKIFVSFVTVFILFSFYKNISGLNKVDNIYLGIQKINNKYILNKISNNEFVSIFHPDVENNSKNGWQGRLCWNTPFICSYNKLDVKKKNRYLIISKIQN
tara:strand:+ start:2253 stop:3905 length:1653 start_codon:yes stop_codon:yes gene_type:complete